MTFKRIVLVVLLLGLVVAGMVGWTNYERNRADYDAYRSLIQQGIHIAGVQVGWHTPEEAARQVEMRVAEPYYRDFTVAYAGESLTISTVGDLGLRIPVDEMVQEAVAASHNYDYWDGFWLWLQGEAESLDLDVPFRMSYDEQAAARILQGVAEEYDLLPVEPMLDVRALTFLPGSPGRYLEPDDAAALINESVPSPNQRHVVMSMTVVEPDQSPARVESMLGTLGPVMAQEPSAPTFFTATVPISSTGGLENTPLVTYSGELTWTFPQLAQYSGHLTTTYAFLFVDGEPGANFDVEKATKRVEAALKAGESSGIQFESEPVPPPPITSDLLVPVLEERLGRFPGVGILYVRDLDTGEVVYEANADYVLSGMSVVKIAIMVEIYRRLGGELDEEIHQELLDMLGSESCNPCANRLLAAIGGGSADVGAQRVTNTMRNLGLANFYLCAPFRVVALPSGEGQLIWAAFLPAQTEEAKVPGYDRCVRATPREMADLLEMIYECTQDRGLLSESYPQVFAPGVCHEMLDIMAANDLRNMLGAGIPDDVRMAHKHGFAGYDVPWGDTRAEVGIIYSPGATYLVTFYIWDDTPWINWGVVQPLYRDISNILYNYLNPEEPYWPRPPWTPPPEEGDDAEGA